MGGENQRYNKDIDLKENDGSVTSGHAQWVFMENGNGVCSDSESIESNFDEDSSSLLSSSSSERMVEEDNASSSSTSLSSSTSAGPLYELSELMDQLPIKRGLSNYYQGKSQSFTSLASVKSLEDLAKKASPYRKRVKPREKYSPKATIRKKSCSRGSSFVSSPGKNRAGTFVGTSNSYCRPSISVVQKHF